MAACIRIMSLFYKVIAGKKNLRELIIFILSFRLVRNLSFLFGRIPDTLR